MKLNRISGICLDCLGVSMGLQSEMMFLNDNLEKSSFLSEITTPIGQIREMMRYLFRLLWRGNGSMV